MEDTTPSYEQLYMEHQRVLAEYYRDTVDFHKQIIQLKDELAEAKLALQKAQQLDKYPSMKNKDTQLLEEAYKTILKEEASPMPTTDIFDAYQEVGMSAEMGMQNLITSAVQQILKEVPQEDQARAHAAVKGLWINMVKSWSSLEGYQD